MSSSPTSSEPNTTKEAVLQPTFNNDNTAKSMNDLAIDALNIRDKSLPHEQYPGPQLQELHPNYIPPPAPGPATVSAPLIPPRPHQQYYQQPYVPKTQWQPKNAVQQPTSVIESVQAPVAPQTPPVLMSAPVPLPVAQSASVPTSSSVNTNTRSKLNVNTINPNNKTLTTITATITTNEDQSRSIAFAQAQRPPPNKAKRSTQLSPGVAAQVLTPAQQREAEADAYIQRAIELHEGDQLEEATYYFRLAAQSENPVGQLMYGLSLRHGWGCNPNPKEAIVYLQRAAAYAMNELKDLLPGNTANIRAIQQQQQKHEAKEPSASNTNNSMGSTNLRRMGTVDRRSAVVTARKELVMALYELGMSFLKGWGVQKDKTVAFNYFKLAADLGDADSQNETAQCFMDGIGTEKDAFEAARYYRLACAQGATQFGNSWIWKPKYDKYCEEHAAAAAAASAARKAQQQNQQHQQHQEGGEAQGFGAAPNSSDSSTSSNPIAAGLATVRGTSVSSTLPTSPQEAAGSRMPASRRGQYNIAGDLISSSQLELKLQQAEQLTTATVGPIMGKQKQQQQQDSTGSTTTGGKKKHRWSLWGLHQNRDHTQGGFHRRLPSLG